MEWNTLIIPRRYQICWHIQDFEALTPNLLARTIETVEGGGIVVLLLSTLTSLTQLYSLTMDVHSRLRTESHQDVTGQCCSCLGPSCLLSVMTDSNYPQYSLAADA